MSKVRFLALQIVAGTYRRREIPCRTPPDVGRLPTPDSQKAPLLHAVLVRECDRREQAGLNRFRVLFAPKLRCQTNREIVKCRPDTPAAAEQIKAIFAGFERFSRSDLENAVANLFKRKFDNVVVVDPGF